MAQLLALEWLLGVGMPDKLKEAPLAVKALYDEDVADEVSTLAYALLALGPAVLQLLYISCDAQLCNCAQLSSVKNTRIYPPCMHWRAVPEPSNPAAVHVRHELLDKPHVLIIFGYWGGFPTTMPDRRWCIRCCSRLT
jgi:hypothetical protein